MKRMLVDSLSWGGLWVECSFSEMGSCWAGGYLEVELPRGCWRHHHHGENGLTWAVCEACINQWTRRVALPER